MQTCGHLVTAVVQAVVGGHWAPNVLLHRSMACLLGCLVGRLVAGCLVSGLVSGLLAWLIEIMLILIR